MRVVTEKTKMEMRFVEALEVRFEDGSVTVFPNYGEEFKVAVLDAFSLARRDVEGASGASGRTAPSHLRFEDLVLAEAIEEVQILDNRRKRRRKR